MGNSSRTPLGWPAPSGEPNDTGKADNTDSTGAAQLFLTGGLFLSLAFLAPLGGWLVQLTGWSIFGMSPEHLFNDLSALALLSIGALLDGLSHSRNL